MRILYFVDKFIINIKPEVGRLRGAKRDISLFVNRFCYLRVMKKTLYLLFTATVFTALLLGCGKETQSSTQGGGLFKVRVTITPPLQSGSTNGGLNLNQILISSNFFYYQWVGTNSSTNLSVYESQEYSVTKGQNLPVSVSLLNQYDYICRQVTIEGLTDNKVFKTVTLELGIKSTTPTILYCKDSQNPQVNFIIP